MSANAAYMESHAINQRLAYNAGVRGDGEATLTFRYGYSYLRKRLPDGKMMQPRGQSLSLYWPVGGRQSAHVLLCEGEADTLAAASVLCTDDGKPREDLPPPLLGLCPVGLPGATTPSRVVCGELIAGGCLTAMLAFDGDDAGRRATDNIGEALTRYGIETFPLYLPDGKDLSDCLAATDDRTDWLANFVADAETVPA